MIAVRNAEATQGRLMEAALALYAERGYAGTCLDEVLRRAASSKGAFYHHFASKEDLTAQALSRYWRERLEVIAAAWGEAETPTDKLGALLSRLETGDDALSCPLGMLGFESRSLPERARQALRDGLACWSARVGALLTELALEPTQARALAEQLFLVYEGGVLLERVSGSREPLTAALERWRAEVLAEGTFAQTR